MIRRGVAILLVLGPLGAVAIAQMTPGLGPMVPETNGPGPASGNLIPNEGEMTPNPVSSSPPPTGCSGTGYDFTQACNSQYVVVL